MPQSATVTRVLLIITVPFCQCLTVSRSVQLRGAAREALGGTGLLHIWEDAVAEGEGTACSKAKDKRCSARLAGVEGGGIGRAAAVTQKKLFPYHPPNTVNVFPAQIPWETRRELDSAVEKRI